MQRLLWSLAFGPYARRSTPPGRVRLARILHRPVARLIRRADVARTNLRLCFPELNEGDVIDLERRAFQSLLRVYLEIPGLAAGSPVEIVKRLDIENLSLLRDGEIDERGAILLSGHLGNWELLAMAAAVASGIVLETGVSEPM